jgi:hypothetical protein
MTDDTAEHNIWLSPHDMDHLNEGQPVYKRGPDDTLLTLRPASWSELEEIQG